MQELYVHLFVIFTVFNRYYYKRYGNLYEEAIWEAYEENLLVWLIKFKVLKGQNVESFRFPELSVIIIWAGKKIKVCQLSGNYSEISRSHWIYLLSARFYKDHLTSVKEV